MADTIVEEIPLGRFGQESSSTPLGMEDREQKLVKSISNEFIMFQQERHAKMDPVWDECYTQYRTQAPDPRRSGDWRSKIHVPHGFTNVEDVVPHLMEGIFGGDRPYKVNADLAPDLARAHERLLDHQWQENMDTESSWEDVTKMAAIFGTGAFFTGFRILYEDRKTWHQQQSTEDPSLSVPVIIKKRMPTFVGNYIEPIHVYNLYPHPRGTPDDLKKVYWVQYRTRAWLEKTQRFKNLHLLKDSMQFVGRTSENAPAMQRNKMGEMNDNFSNNTATEPEFRVITLYDDDNKLVFTMVGEQGSEILIEEGEYPFWHNMCPIRFVRYTQVPKEFWGIGVIEPNISLFHESDTIRNQRRDNFTLAMNMMLEVRENEIDDEEAELVSRPGGIVHSTSGNAVKPIIFPYLGQESIAEEQVNRNDIRSTTGLGGPLSGQTDPNSPSGTKFSLQQKAQLLRLSRAIKRSARVVKDSITMMVANNSQFYPLPEVKAVLGPILFTHFSQVQPDDITLHALITVKPVGTFANEEVARQQFANWMNIIGNHPVMSQKLDYDEVLRLGMSQFDFITNPDALLKKGPTIDIIENRIAHQENVEMAQGAVVPPADPGEDHAIHMAHHEQLLAERSDDPKLTQSVSAHLTSHEQAKAQAEQFLLASQLSAGSGGPNGPGSTPSGNGGGVVNPNRQPQPTSQQGIVQGAARATGRA